MTRARKKTVIMFSMTGHGRGQAKDKFSSMQVEVSSVNRKQLDIRVNIPRELSILEPVIHDRVGDRVSRGSINVLVRYSSSSGADQITINEDLARRYIKELRRAGKLLKLRDDLSIRSVLSLPDVIQIRSKPNEKGVENLLKTALDSALDGLLEMRAREGGVLSRDIKQRFISISALVKSIKMKSKGVARRYRQNLVARIKDAGADIEADSPQIIRELAIFADKADITEELVRLDSHLEQAKEIMAKGGSVGRTLDFLCQEIFREINTVGSKANDSAISRIVVNFKAELEAVREQVQNVE